jgi:hypothetical protein
LRPIQGDEGDVALGCEADIFVTHPTILSYVPRDTEWPFIAAIHIQKPPV